MEFTQFLKYLSVFAVGFCVSYIATVPVARAAFSVGAVDVPRDLRRMHTRVTATSGGIAIFSALAIAVLCYVRGEFSALSGALLSGGAISAALGFCDDVTPLPPKLKLAGECCVALIPLSFGIFAKEVEFFGVSFPLPFPFSFLFSFLWIVTVTNAINLIDGLDGLAAGVGFVASLALFARYSLYGAKPDIAILPLALASVLLGFLPHNTKKAKIFMGDCGSLSLGYSLSVLTITDGNYGSGTFPILAATLILAYPLTDTAFAIIRRTKNKSGIFCADKNHIHHRLVKRGYSKAETAFLLVFLTAVASVISLFV